jgi:hypothetical protein
MLIAILIIGAVLNLLGLLGMMILAMAAFMITRDKGYNRALSTLGILLLVVALPAAAGAGAFYGVVGIEGTEEIDVEAAGAAAALIVPAALLGAGALCWSLARRSPRRPRIAGRRARRLHYGWWGVAAGVLVVPVGLLLWRLDDWMMGLRSLTVTVPLVSLLRHYERRYRNQINEDAALEPGTYVLFLRGFLADLRTDIRAQDAETSWAAGAAKGWVNIDQFLNDRVEAALGRFVALGSPRDKLPPGGARRLYPTEASWTDYVRELAGGARAILMFPGHSRAVDTELGLIREVRAETRLFVITAPAERSTRFSRATWRLMTRLCGWRETAWPEFAELLTGHGLRGGADPGPGAVLGFEASGARVDLARGCGSPDAYVEAIARGLDRPTSAAPSSPRSGSR